MIIRFTTDIDDFGMRHTEVIPMSKERFSAAFKRSIREYFLTVRDYVGKYNIYIGNCKIGTVNFDKMNKVALRSEAMSLLFDTYGDIESTTENLIDCIYLFFGASEDLLKYTNLVNNLVQLSSEVALSPEGIPKDVIVYDWKVLYSYKALLNWLVCYRDVIDYKNGVSLFDSLLLMIDTELFRVIDPLFFSESVFEQYLTNRDPKKILDKINRIVDNTIAGSDVVCYYGVLQNLKLSLVLLTDLTSDYWCRELNIDYELDMEFLKGLTLAKYMVKSLLIYGKTISY